MISPYKFKNYKSDAEIASDEEAGLKSRWQAGEIGAPEFTSRLSAIGRAREQLQSGAVPAIDTPRKFSSPSSGGRVQDWGGGRMVMNYGAPPAEGSNDPNISKMMREPSNPTLQQALRDNYARRLRGEPQERIFPNQTLEQAQEKMRQQQLEWESKRANKWRNR